MKYKVIVKNWGNEKHKLNKDGRHLVIYNVGLYEGNISFHYNIMIASLSSTRYLLRKTYKRFPKETHAHLEISINEYFLCR